MNDISFDQHLASSVPLKWSSDGGGGLLLSRLRVRPDPKHCSGGVQRGCNGKDCGPLPPSRHQRAPGSRGNIAVLTGPDGKLLVDAEIVTARTHVIEALASINADPIKQLVNTHWHFDHAGGNEWVHQAGGSILAHENTRKHLSRDTRVGGNFNYTFPASPAGALPSTVFGEEHTLHANNTTLILKHYQPAHTDSDISVYFAEADVLHTGDTFWNRDYPFIDYWTGGSIDGQIRAAEANIAKVTDKTIVVPGHGAVGTKADLVLLRDVLVDVRDKVAALKKQGRSLSETIAAKPGARYDEVWASYSRAEVTSLPWYTKVSSPSQGQTLRKERLSS